MTSQGAIVGTLQYHYPFPFYYGAYHEFLSNGGVPYAAAVGSCGPPRFLTGAHGVSRAGFGHTGASHSACA